MTDFISEIPRLVAVDMSFLVGFLLLVRLLPLNTARYTMLFGLATVLKSSVLYLIDGSFVNILPVIISSTITVSVIVLLAGMIGKSLSADNYASLMFGFGLFPWTASTFLTVLYLIIAGISTIIYVFVRSKRGFKHVGSNRIMNRDEMKKYLKPEDYEKLRKHGSVIFATPLIFSAIAATALLYL